MAHADEVIRPMPKFTEVQTMETQPVQNVHSSLSIPAEVNEQRWRTVCARQADPTFVYGVTTTGIFCRPDCSSRRPLPENVCFYENAAAAQAAGFRACLRCRPSEAAIGADTEARVVANACRWIEQHPDRPVRTAELAQRAGVSPAHFHRMFTRIAGLTPKRFADAQRMQSFKTGLRGGATVTDRMYASGFGSPSRLHAASGTRLGMSPSAYRKGATGISIHFTHVETAMGTMLLAATERGICFLQFGESAEQLHTALQRDFPYATLHLAAGDAHPDFPAWVEAIQDYISDGGTSRKLPLDLQATVFQQRVWEYLQTIPAGESRSYAKAAEELGVPTATRAVASACARNRVALLVPCHRVLRGDGTLGGYRWGLERKAELLRREAAATRDSQTPASPSTPSPSHLP